MIGSSLTRFYEGKFLLFDKESEGLNLFTHRPWELSYAIASLKNGIESIHTSYILWEDLDITEDAARMTRFDKTAYLAKARPPQDVWNEFSPLLYDPAIRKVGHNISSFDIYMVSTLRRALGLPVDHTWNRNSLDTNALSKAYIKGWVPDISSPEAFLGWQAKCQNFLEKGFKSNLGLMCEMLGVPYDPSQGHGAQYDIERNWLIFKELVFKMDF